MSQWHIDYLELKLLNKWPVQEGTWTLLSASLKVENKFLIGKVHSLPQEVKRHPYQQNKEFIAEKPL